MGYKFDQFKKKFKKFTRKALLTTAFMGAAGTPLYHYYGTREDIIAQVVSVDSDFTVRTDKGIFSNDPTYMYLKNERDVAQIDRLMQPGQNVKLTVYGFNPHIGSFSLSSIGIHRNISNAAKVAPALLGTPTQTAAPGSGGNDVDTMEPGMSEDNANIEAINQKMPQLGQDLAIMNSLPLTGKPVYDILKDPVNNMRTSLTATPVGVPASAAYSNHRLRVPRNTGTASVFHEAFHAAQDVRDGDNDMFTLTQRDAVVANLLTEAAAVAYELAAQKEAANRGISFHTRDSSVGGASDKKINKDAFEKAYNKSWSANASLPAEEREAKALEAGGQAVVRFLLAGGDSSWSQAYVNLVVSNINNNLGAFTANERSARYPAQRDKVFSKQGDVLPKINFIPAEYLGPDAPQFIQQCFQTMGFRTSAVLPAKSKIRFTA